MQSPRALVAALAFVLALAPAAFGELAEPPVNQGATDVRVDGTRVTAEAWAIARGHKVDAIVVTRLVPKAGAAPQVQTYERWDLDGRTKSERGDRKLGKAWEKHLWGVLDAAAKGKSKVRRKKRELVDRALKSLGPSGERTIDGYVLSWSVGEGLSLGSGGRSVARVAIFAYTPAGPGPPTTPPSDPTAPPTTPREKAAPRGGGPAGNPPPPQKAPVTPGGGPAAGRPSPLPRPPCGTPGLGRASGSGSVEGSANSETGVRKHARVEVDLGRNLATPAPRKPAPRPVTPRER